MANPCVIGVDLGGTNVRARALYVDGTPAGNRFENSSRAQEGTEAILDAMISTIRQAASGHESEVVGVGIAVPGHVDNDAGMVRWAPNLGAQIDGVFHCWKDVPLTKPLSEKISYPITLGNDANLAALGEYKYGSGKNAANCLVMLTMGTGIGGGVVMAPRAVHGKASGPLLLVGGNCGGGELGHAVIIKDGMESPAGTYGTLESYCQRDAIIRRAQSKLMRGRASSMLDAVEGDLSRITPKIIAQEAQSGDEAAIEVLEEIGSFLGVGVGNMINIFAPSVVAIGGQIAKAGDILMQSVRKSARNVAITSLWNDCEILPAEVLEDAGLLGAAALAFEAVSA